MDIKLPSILHKAFWQEQEEFLKIANKKDLKSKLKKLIESDEAVLIEFVVEKEENVYPMIPAGTSVEQMVGKRGVLEND